MDGFTFTQEILQQADAERATLEEFFAAHESICGLAAETDELYDSLLHLHGVTTAAAHAGLDLHAIVDPALREYQREMVAVTVRSCRDLASIAPEATARFFTERAGAIAGIQAAIEEVLQCH